MKSLKLKKLLAGLTLTATLLAPFSAYALTIPEGRATSGDLTISGSRTEDSVKSAINVLASSGDTAVTVASATGFSAGDYIYIGQMTGTGAGNYEINKIRSISTNTLNLFFPTISAYQSSGAQVIKILEYHNVTVASGGNWSASSWNGTTGGVLIALLNGGLTLQSGGTITMTGNGYAGGGGSSTQGTQGTGTNGSGGASSSANGNGGGGGDDGVGNDAVGGGGGGNANSGSDGTKNGGSAGVVGSGGASAGSATLSTSAVLGGGGGGSECNTASCTAGSGTAGGGFIMFVTASTTVTAGTFASNGTGGSGCGASGGAGSATGAGGSIRLPARLNITLGTTITANAGAVVTTNCNGNGGAGSDGRVATVSGATVSGTTNPTINTSSTDRVENKDNEAQKMLLSFSM